MATKGQLDRPATAQRIIGWLVEGKSHGDVVKLLKTRRVKASRQAVTAFAHRHAPTINDLVQRAVETLETNTLHVKSERLQELIWQYEQQKEIATTRGYLVRERGSSSIYRWPKHRQPPRRPNETLVAAATRFGGRHRPPDLADRYDGSMSDSLRRTATVVLHRGKVFSAPFICLCCGVGISDQQGLFSLHCAHCDTGSCRRSARRPSTTGIRYIFTSYGWYEEGHGRFFALWHEAEGVAMTDAAVYP